MFTASTVQDCHLLLRQQADRHGQFAPAVINEDKAKFMGDTTGGTHKVGLPPHCREAINRAAERDCK
jgi:hypothetical protein